MADGGLLKGGCHCGNVQFEFTTAIRPADFAPRACDCSFCLKHGAAYISDPDGRLVIEVADSNAVGEYRQGSGTARFLLCRNCGVMVAVIFDGDGRSYGTVNANCIAGGVVFGACRVVSPRNLSAEEKKRRWAKIWTPGVVVRVTPG